jgi:aminoglycoside phosphotransferase (APT) family kinase protein
VPAGEWRAEIVVDSGLVRRLLRHQFGELEVRSLERLGEGWDNSVWLVDEHWVFRFPRRQIAVPAVARQAALLPRLAPLLPLPIPEPAFVGRPSNGFPWPFFGAPLLQGREAARSSPSDDERAGAATPLGEFLRALHAASMLELEGVAQLPFDPMGRADMAKRVRMTHDRLRELREEGVWAAPAQVDELLVEAAALAASSQAALAHGDLHLRHLLVAEDGTPTAVVDWDDLCVGDPAIDLVLYWSYLPPAARPTFRATYGPLGDDQLLRARVLSVFLCGTLAVYGRHEGDRALEVEAVAGLDRTVMD